MTDKELQISGKIFGYKNPEELEQALIEADIKEKYNGLLNYFNIKQTVFREQIKTKIYVSRTKLENLVIFVKNILDSVRLYNDIPELGSKETDEQPGEWLKIWTPNQMLSRLQISLAQLKAKKNSEELKNQIRRLLYSLYRSKRLAKQIYKSLIDII